MTRAESAEEHGVIPSAVSKGNSVLEEEGFEGLKTTNGEGNQRTDPQLKQ